jgi:two-component system sensor histidine kinase UhpB
MKLLAALPRRLLRLSLFAKILVANSAIVALGATAGTYLTTEHVRRSPHETHYEMMLIFAVGGLALSLALNALVLRGALLPLARLERIARRVSEGDVNARARLSTIGDPDTDQLAMTFNTMLDSLAARAQEIQTYSTRLQELSDRVLLAQEEERRRLARELHDDTGQVLSTLLLHLKLFRDAAGQPGADAAALEEQASALAELARDALDGIRRLALELRPRMLDDLGLAAALRAYVDEWRERTAIAATLDVVLPPDRSLPNTAEIAIYRMVQEALANVARHARATRVGITLAPETDHLVVEVRDNGKGMDGARSPGGLHRTSAISGADIVAAGLGAGLGLFGIQERIGLAGGTLHVESAPGRGTTLRAALPLPTVASSPPTPPPSSAPSSQLAGNGLAPNEGFPPTSTRRASRRP